MSVNSDGEREEIGSSVSCCTGAPSRATTAPPVPHRHESDVSEELTHRAQPAAVLLFLRQAMQHCRRLSTACCGSAGQRGRYYTTEKRRWPPGIRFLDSRRVSGQAGHGQIRPATLGESNAVWPIIPKCRWSSIEEWTPESSQLVGILTFGQKSDSVQFPSSRTMQTWVASSGLLRQAQTDAG